MSSFATSESRYQVNRETPLPMTYFLMFLTSGLFQLTSHGSTSPFYPAGSTKNASRRDKVGICHLPVGCKLQGWVQKSGTGLLPNAVDRLSAVTRYLRSYDILTSIRAQPLQRGLFPFPAPLRRRSNQASPTPHSSAQTFDRPRRYHVTGDMDFLPTLGTKALAYLGTSLPVHPLGECEVVMTLPRRAARSRGGHRTS